MDANRLAGSVIGCITMLVGALVALNAVTVQSRIRAFYRRNPHLQFDLGWSNTRSYVLLLRCWGIIAFSIGALATALLWTQ